MYGPGGYYYDKMNKYSTPTHDPHFQVGTSVTERNETYFDLAARRSARVVAWKPALIGATDLACKEE